MEIINDSQLITMYLEGNPKAFESLVNRYAQMIYRFTLKLVGNKEEAHDITQETLIKAWKSIKKFDKKRNFKTWIFTIAQRTSIDSLRKRKDVNISSMDNDESGVEMNIPDNELMPDELFERQENVELIQKALETISIEEKTIILLHNGEEMTFDDIAEILNKSINTIKSKYRRSLITLKDYIIKQNAPKQP